MASGFRFEHTYGGLGERFSARVNPVRVAAPRLVSVNAELARELGVDPEWLRSPAGVEVLAGNAVAAGSEPRALAYAGHQFGGFVPSLGDGRANLLGEVVAGDGKRYDVQLKGSGRTPFSRGGDGRAALGPVLREYLVSEAMHALGVPTARALAAVTTGEEVVRETMLPGAVVTRVAASHLRVGTFQYFAARQDADALKVLAEYAIQRHYPQASGASKPYRALLEGVIGRHAALVARWMALGFIHGVMNTDNTSISGETIDYGPCAFMEEYDAMTVFSSIDHRGRYAYANQPHAAHWNLTRLAEALLPLLTMEEGTEEKAVESAQAALALFAPQYEAARLTGFRQKLGLLTERDGDAELVEDLLKRMGENGVDFTSLFLRLRLGGARELFAQPGSYDAWEALWLRRMADEGGSLAERVEGMRLASPRFIPRNHLVAALIDAAVERGDYGPFEELLGVVTRPFEDRPGLERFEVPARVEERVTATFCGT